LLDPEEGVHVGAGEVRVDEDDLVPVEGEGTGGVHGDQALADTPLPATDRANGSLEIPHGIDSNTGMDCKQETTTRSGDLRCNTCETGVSWAKDPARSRGAVQCGIGSRISSIGWNHTVWSLSDNARLLERVRARYYLLITRSFAPYSRQTDIGAINQNNLEMVN